MKCWNIVHAPGIGGIGLTMFFCNAAKTVLRQRRHLHRRIPAYGYTRHHLHQDLSEKLAQGTPVIDTVPLKSDAGSINASLVSSLG